MSKYKLVIFDMDGTIADTSSGIFNSIRYTQKMMNLPEITLEQMYSHVGPPMEESYNRNFGLTGERLKQAVAFHKEYAMDRGYKELVLYDGIIELIDSLRSQGVKIAVATLKAQSTAEKIFASLGIVDRFDMIVGADPDNPRSKSQMLDFIVENYCKSMCADEDTDTDFDTNANANVGNVPVLVSEDIARSSIVLIGDSKYDSIGAEESHIDFIAVTYGFGFKSEADVEAYSHVAVCDSVEAISKSL